MVNLHHKLIHAHSLQYLLHDGQNFGIRNHKIVLSRNVEIALVKLSKSAFVHGGLVPSINLPDMESLNLLNISIISHESCEGHS